MNDQAAALGSLHDQITAQVLRELTTRLAAVGSPLVADRVVSRELGAQVRGILDRAFASLETLTGALSEAGLHQPVVAAADTHIGRVRANQNIHPSDSMAAADLLFEVSLHKITKLAPGIWETAALALALHRAILENVGPASTTYVNVLLGRLSGAHIEERLAISRDLHDRVAHGIAVAQQQLHLSGFVDSDDEGASYIRVAVDGLQRTLSETQLIATELRYLVGSQELHEALTEFAQDADPSLTPVLVSIVGEAQRLMSGVQEEAFIVIRELVGNARRHANATVIRVDFAWSPTRVLVTVSDDGQGFNRADVRPGALGLIGARERAEVIGAELEIIASNQPGTVITLAIPITEVER